MARGGRHVPPKTPSEARPSGVRLNLCDILSHSDWAAAIACPCDRWGRKDAGTSHMRIRILLLLLGVIIAPADAAMPRPAEVIVVSNFSFRPSQFELRAGEPVLLEFRNESGSGHSFSAPAFFASARMDARSAALVRDGRVELPPRSQVGVTLTPTTGHYKFKCTHMFHAMLGMTGTISVR